MTVLETFSSEQRARESELVPFKHFHIKMEHVYSAWRTCIRLKCPTPDAEESQMPVDISGWRGCWSFELIGALNRCLQKARWQFFFCVSIHGLKSRPIKGFSVTLMISCRKGDQLSVVLCKLQSHTLRRIIGHRKNFLWISKGRMFLVSKRLSMAPKSSSPTTIF